MLRSLKSLKGYRILAKNGELGTVHDFYFDDENWVVRYLVVDTGVWLPGRKVLVAAQSLCRPEWTESCFPVSLTRQQVKDSPHIDTNKPVSRQHQARLHRYYGWPFYWVNTGGYPGSLAPAAPSAPLPPTTSEEEDMAGDPHLRSSREVMRYGIHAVDGPIGHVDDFIVEDSSWILRYMVIATRNWLPGRKVLIAPQWLVGDIDWSAREVNVLMSQESIKNSPEFNPAAPVNREYEARLYDYYGRPGYWEEIEETADRG